MTTLYEPPPNANVDSSTLGADTRIKLGFLITLIVIAIPLIASYVSIRNELAQMRNDLIAIRAGMGDRWTTGMMVLWVERLKYENTGKLNCPDVNRVRDDTTPRGGS